MWPTRTLVVYSEGVFVISIPMWLPSPSNTGKSVPVLLTNRRERDIHTYKNVCIWIEWMRRTKEEAAETKEKIFKAGIRVFAKKGFAGAGLADIAREAGVTRGAIYWHFKNKEAFFQELLHRVDHYYQSLIDHAGDEERPFRELLRDAVREMIRKQSSEPEWQMMQEIVVRDSLNRREADGREDMYHMKRVENTGAIYLDEMIARGEVVGFSDGYTATIAMSCFISGWIIQALHLQSAPTDRQIDEMVEFAVRGLCGTEERNKKEEGSDE